MNTHTFFTDGSVAKNKGGSMAAGPGAFAYIEVSNDLVSKLSQHVSPTYRWTTTTRMEMLPIKHILESFSESANITIYSDSEFVVKAMNGVYKKLKENLDLWKDINALRQKHKVTMIHCRAHGRGKSTGQNPLVTKNNDIVDQLVFDAANKEEWTLIDGEVEGRIPMAHNPMK